MSFEDRAYVPRRPIPALHVVLVSVSLLHTLLLFSVSGSAWRTLSLSLLHSFPSRWIAPRPSTAPPHCHGPCLDERTSLCRRPLEQASHLSTEATPRRARHLRRGLTGRAPSPRCPQSAERASSPPWVTLGLSSKRTSSSPRTV